MPNPVYSLVSEALSRVVSERAADTMLRAALRDANVPADGVNAQDMQRILAGPLQARLVAIMPPHQARRELTALARRLQGMYPKAPTLFTEAPAAPPAGPALPAASAAAEPAGTHEAAFSADDFDLDAEDFLLDDPEEAARFTLPVREYALGTASGQDRLLADLARFQGVQGVVLCDAGGRVVRSRVAHGADALGAVMAATTTLFKQRRWKILTADLGAQTVCVRPLDTHFVALLSASNSNLGRLIAELSALKESA